MLEQLVPREDLAASAHEGLEQRELFRRQLDLDFAAPDLPRGGIQNQVTRLEHARAFGRCAPGEGAQPGEELREREGLGQIVVGARVEAGDPILDGVARGQHEHRRPAARLTEPPADLEAVLAGQHHV